MALRGGIPVRTRPWPQWPIADEHTVQLLRQVLGSRSWTLTGQSQSLAPFDRQIGCMWADYVGVRYALACSSGTAALSLALDALDIGPGDEVLVPGLTWIACPQSVVNAGATPVLVDIDPATLSMCPGAARATMTDRTRAIMVVHAYCSVADVDAFLQLSAETGIPIIEDCAQAHGAAWRGRRVGSFGLISTFSTHQSKTLTSGEGGLCCTNDHDVFVKLMELRTDGRVYAAEVSPENWMGVTRTGTTQGRNLVLSEVGCALLVDGLGKLDAQNRTREANLRRLGELLREVPGAGIIEPHPAVTSRTVSRLVIRLDLERFGGATLADVGRAVTAELGLPVEPLDLPLNAHPLYNPLALARAKRRDDAARLHPSRYSLPAAAKESARCLAAPHFCLLGNTEDVADIAMALGKVYEHRQEMYH